MAPAPDQIEEVLFFKVGSCRAPERAVRSKGRWRWLEFPASVAVLRHRKHGIILFDTGYAPRYFDILRSFPFMLLGPALGARLPREEELLTQLARFDIHPEDVRTVLISHFHLDHISGLRDFPRAHYIYSKTAWDSVAEACGLRAFHKVFHPACLPPDFARRSRLLTSSESHPKDVFPETWDVFGDGSITAISLPGHAAGQFGIRFQCHGKDYFLVADACWHQANIGLGELPHPLAMLAFDSRHDFEVSLGRLRQFAAASPDTLLLPNHCLKTMEGHFSRA